MARSAFGIGGCDDHAFETFVDVVEPRVTENNVSLTFDGRADDPETFVATVGGIDRVRADQAVSAHVPESAIHVFDPSTGEPLRSRDLSETELVELVTT